MDKVAYITGSSRGIGKALALALIDEGYYVFGLSRSNDISSNSFKHIEIDLSDLSEVVDFKFEVSGKETLLVNNAGMIGDIAPVGQLEDIDISKTMNVNTIAPQILINRFVKRFKNNSGSYHILNISSGAGKRAITSWASYCASKAAIDLFSETVAAELDWKHKSNWRIHSCAPGVVDTSMQDQIRSTNEEDFAHVANFIAYRENNELYSPEYVATKLLEVIQSPSDFPDTIISVRDF